ncbi:homeodomain-interacting protein kinase 2-like [Entelurus aequoreus]|uniref:homeodomain-interacting protein kinase 2-like n=1 Tax=Entelurus aequoreus TaxID=161455 RepID=UPI002B1DF3F4|nr:homeodomain-interacting protein kinase 2-like [Entelurus aequoreus]XP_061904879.1 homeodomain-interacting protein kinase 2-like [Entelurus aequoreus]
MDSPSAAGDCLYPGAKLHSPSSCYKVLSVLGEGTFGKVAKCRKLDNNKTVAVKMIRNQGNFAVQAKFEIEALQKIQMLENSKPHLVQWNSTFSDMGYICLEFEYLDKSLFDFMKERNFKPLQVKEIRPIVHQLARALEHLKAACMIHADLKLENIMFINHQQQPYRVKVIDFGLTHEISDARQGSYIQSRPYRSPEILVGAPYNEAIDMWSVGCVTAFLYTGTLIFPGKNDYEMIRFITETQGPFPDSLLASGKKTGHFFHRENETNLWSIKTTEKYQQETGIVVKTVRKLKLSSLDHLLQLQQFQWCFTKHPSDQVVYSADKQMFVDMLKGMFQLDASQRMTPLQVLDHHFISMSHLWPHFAASPHVRFCYGIMAACESKAPNSKKSGALQQNTSKTTPSVLHKLASERTNKKTGPCRTKNRAQSGQKKKTKDEVVKQPKRFCKKIKTEAQHSCMSDHLYVKPMVDSTQPRQVAGKGNLTRTKRAKNAKQCTDLHAEKKPRMTLRKDKRKEIIPTTDD